MEMNKCSRENCVFYDIDFPSRCPILQLEDLNDSLLYDYTKCKYFVDTKVIVNDIWTKILRGY